MKKLKVDHNLCIGCGTCTVLAPKSFKLNPEGKADPIEPVGDEEQKVQEAITSCPVAAISWVEDQKPPTNVQTPATK